MQESAIYYKTRKGVEEIAHRTHRLPSRLRSTLILIDGHTPMQELKQRLMMGDESLAAFEILIREGYISPLEANEPITEMEM